MNGLTRPLVAEFVGTFALILVGAGAAAILGFGGSLVTVALAHGLTIMFMAYAYGHISGVHINPAVTIGLWTAGKFETSRVIPFIVAQLLGAIVAGFALSLVFAGTDSTLGATVVNYDLTTLSGAFMLETVGTFFLVNTVLYTAVEGKAGRLAPLAIGMTVAADIMFFGPLTGASVNPARTLGPAVAAGIYTDIWMYMVATVLGGVLAAVLYRGLLREADPEVPPGRAAANL